MTLAQSAPVEQAFLTIQSEPSQTSQAMPLLAATCVHTLESLVHVVAVVQVLVPVRQTSPDAHAAGQACQELVTMSDRVTKMSRFLREDILRLIFLSFLRGFFCCFFFFLWCGFGSFF